MGRKGLGHLIYGRSGVGYGDQAKEETLKETEYWFVCLSSERLLASCVDKGWYVIEQS